MAHRVGPHVRSRPSLSGHSGTCCWLDPVENDPTRTLAVGILPNGIYGMPSRDIADQLGLMPANFTTYAAPSGPARRGDEASLDRVMAKIRGVTTRADRARSDWGRRFP